MYKTAFKRILSTILSIMLFCGGITATYSAYSSSNSNLRRGLYSSTFAAAAASHISRYWEDGSYFSVITITPGNSSMVVDGEAVPITPLEIDGDQIYIALGDVSDVLGFDVNLNQDTGDMVIRSEGQVAQLRRNTRGRDASANDVNVHSVNETLTDKTLTDETSAEDEDAVSKDEILVSVAPIKMINADADSENPDPDSEAATKTTSPDDENTAPDGEESTETASPDDENTDPDGEASTEAASPDDDNTAPDGEASTEATSPDGENTDPDSEASTEAASPDGENTAPDSEASTEDTSTQEITVSTYEVDPGESQWYDLNELENALNINIEIANNAVHITKPFQLCQLILQTRSGASPRDNYGAIEHVSDGNGLFLLQYENSQAAETAYELLSADTDTRYVEPNHVVVGDSLSWGTDRIGANSYKQYLLNDNKTAGVTVAVLDTGVDASHPFLSARMVSGRDIIAATNNPFDVNGHGTHVAGTVVDCTNANVKIMPIKVLGDDGRGSSLHVALGIDWAVSNGAKVINMSLGGYGSGSLETTAVNNAFSQGVVSVAAAGNDAKDTAEHLSAYHYIVVCTGFCGSEQQQ